MTAEKFDLSNIPGLDEALQAAAREIYSDIHQRTSITASRRIIVESLLTAI